MTSEFSVAVHALVFLNHKGGYLPSELLADNICTNPARVRKIMAQLKKAGLPETRHGQRCCRSATRWTPAMSAAIGAAATWTGTA